MGRCCVRCRTGGTGWYPFMFSVDSWFSLFYLMSFSQASLKRICVRQCAISYIVSIQMFSYTVSPILLLGFENCVKSCKWFWYVGQSERCPISKDNDEWDWFNEKQAMLLNQLKTLLRSDLIWQCFVLYIKVESFTNSWRVLTSSVKLSSLHLLQWKTSSILCEAKRP